MTVSHVAASVADIDWSVVIGGVATFVTTAVLTWQGIKKGREKVAEKAHIQDESDGGIAIRGGVLMDNGSMIALTRQLVENSQSMHDHARCIDNNTNAQMKVWEQLAEIKIELKTLLRKMDDDDNHRH